MTAYQARPARPPNSSNPQCGQNPISSAIGEDRAQGSNSGSTPIRHYPEPVLGDNAVVQSQIENAIHNDPTLNRRHISVTVTDGNIGLTATVASYPGETVR